MLLADLKGEMLLPDRQLVLNKKATVRGVDLLLCSLTQQEGRISLWILFQNPAPQPVEDRFLDEPQQIATNRTNMLYSPGPEDWSFFVQTMEMGDENLHFNSASWHRLGKEDYRALMALPCLVAGGVDTAWLDEAPLEVLVLAQFTQEDPGAVFPEVATGPVHLHVGDEFRQHLVNQRFSLRIGQEGPAGPQHITGPGGKVCTFYVNGLERQDPWEELKAAPPEKQLQDWMEYAHISREEALERIAQQMPEAEKHLEQVCPRGQDMLMVSYECAEDMHLKFYTTDYLEREPRRDGTAFFAVMGTPEGTVGRHGMKPRHDMLDNIPKTFEGPVDFELMYWQEQLPGETVEAI